MNSPVVFGIGNPLIDILLDCTDEELEHFDLAKGTMQLIDPRRGEEILGALTHKEKHYSPGGSCPNTMIALATFGTPSTLAGTVGDDDLGEIYHKRLQSHHVRSDLTAHPGPTGTSIIMVTPDAERTMNTHLGVCRHFSTQDVDFGAIEQAEYLYFTGYMWDTENQKDAIRNAVATAERSGTRVVFDVADPFAVERNRDAFLTLIADHVDIAFANRSEAAIMFGVDQAERGVERLSELCTVAVVKDGADGSYVREQGAATQYIAPTAATPVDTSGAGDTYAAGFIHGIAQGGSLRDAGCFASYVAGEIIQLTGAQFTADVRRNIQTAEEDGSWKEAVPTAR
jgi:sugar/nucleoside kinase (ribokinase family)